ncbi:EGF-like domain-containing protein [Cavenderia fasciculata]|uniref:EGF-like domain-containing protein n=1 Tax=Cavenderia fasciculata TaxID=261658 RepID=F4PIP3_CACFS|nr:EGF-like domain-containing protein [Cavenderia fasciculata]EGG25420.1 EGF-like domain-containing protein [Cavenderia fasciculata]|eukprot:XP_004363271.1 EGF-like domain-containing protein [Cavenderia fasciculata]
MNSSTASNYVSNGMPNDLLEALDLPYLVILQLSLPLPIVANVSIQVVPMLKNLPNSVEIMVHPKSNHQVVFTTKSFPSLSSLIVTSQGGDSAMEVIVNCSTLLTLRVSSVFNLNLNILNPDLLETIYIYGALVTFPTMMNDYNKLLSLTIANNSLSSYPFTVFPQKLMVLQITSSGMSAIPNLQLPSTLTFFVFDNVSPGIHIDLSNNVNLHLGDVPESFCQARSLTLTDIQYTSFPDCIYCYYMEPFLKLPFSAPPQNFVCNIEFDSMALYSNLGRVTITGKKIGYGNAPGGLAPVPNQKVSFSVVPQNGPSRDVNILLSIPMGYNRDFSVIEAGVSLIGGRVITKLSGIDQLVVYIDRINTYLSHNITLTESNITCANPIQSASTIICDVPKGYPLANAVNYTSTTKALELSGYFGSTATTGTVTVANTINCVIQKMNFTQITCILDSSPQPGPNTLYIKVDESEFISSSLFYIQPNNNNNGSTTTGSTTTATTTTTGGNNGESNQQKCERLTHNCYGHGNCDGNGQCQCNPNYNQIDNCLTKFTNTTIQPNTTNPTVSFDIDGIDFQFDIYSIQELDYDGSIIKELTLIKQSWNVSVTTDNITTLVNYKLNTYNSTISTEIYPNLQVSSNISFSSITRNVTFGDMELILLPNSIKVGFTISYWPFASNLATLRAVFKSTINNDQSVTFDCEKQSIDSFTKDQLSESIQYLRVVKDNIQFSGRFIDFVLSNGRKTYSKTELMSITPVDDDNSDESIALIGINLPQCSQCQLDPDFTPLLIDKEFDNSDCEKSNNWRIIVGCVVGGIGLIAAAIATFMVIKKNKKKNSFNRNMKNKLQKANDDL